MVIDDLETRLKESLDENLNLKNIIWSIQNSHPELIEISELGPVGL